MAIIHLTTMAPTKLELLTSWLPGRPWYLGDRIVRNHRASLTCFSPWRVLLIDPDGVYDPADVNDRVLLGFKGTMGEMELHVMAQRLHANKRPRPGAAS